MSKVGTRRRSNVANIAVSAQVNERLAADGKTNEADGASDMKGEVAGDNKSGISTEGIRKKNRLEPVKWSDSSNRWVTPDGNSRTIVQAKHGHAYLRSAESNELLQEFESEIDPEGEKKVDKNGYLTEGREYKVRCFNLPRNPNKLFVLSGDVSRTLNFRDTYVLYLKNPSLVRIMASPEDREHMREQEVLSTVLKNRSVSITTARSMFRVFGHKCIKKGKPGIDDYWVSDLKDIITIEPPVISLPPPLSPTLQKQRQQQSSLLTQSLSNASFNTLITSNGSTNFNRYNSSPASSSGAIFIRANNSAIDYYYSSSDSNYNAYSSSTPLFSAKKPPTTAPPPEIILNDPKSLAVLTINNNKLFRATISSLSFNKTLLESRRNLHIDSLTKTPQYPTRPISASFALPPNGHNSSLKKRKLTSLSYLSHEELADRCINDHIGVARKFQSLVFNDYSP